MNLNNIGLLLKHKMIEPELVLQVYTPNMVIWIWEAAYRVIKVWREAINYPEQCEGFEHLYNEAKRLYPNIRSFEDNNNKLLEISGESEKLNTL